MSLDINKIVQQQLSENCYDKQEVKKTQIYLHGTAGGSNPYNVISGWKANANKICTPFLIAGEYYKNNANQIWKDGDIFQTFPSKYSAFHLGLDKTHFNKFGLQYKNLNSSSIAIELTNWGYLTKDSGDNFRSYLNTIIPSDEVIELDQEYRGHKYYHAYTNAQIASLKDLLVYLCDKYSIPKAFNSNMFEQNAQALSGQSGIWTHTSVRGKNKYDKWDKFDCFPQSNLIEMLKSLT